MSKAARCSNVNPKHNSECAAPHEQRSAPAIRQSISYSAKMIQWLFFDIPPVPSCVAPT
jgi:hypothetical protein